MDPALNNLLEVRIYGLNKSITSEALGDFLGTGGVNVRGITMHPQAKGFFQWAQVYVASEPEMASLLALRDALAANGITISRVTPAPVVPKNIMTPPHTTWDIMSQLSRTAAVASPAFGSPSLYGKTDPAASLPRNLYILNLPLDLAQVEFKALFTPFGEVEHSILLSQLDGMGRRRGFVLMASHCEAIEVMHQMHGKWIDGFKLDLTWALVQREAKTSATSTLPNRVVHPPGVSRRAEPTPECSVLVEDLDPFLFPDTESISAIFQMFGPIHRVVKLADSSVLIQFENVISATSIVAANGLKLGDRVLAARPLCGSGPAVSTFDPFLDGSASWMDDIHKKHQQLPITPQSSFGVTRLNAQSQPFVPNFSKSSVESKTLANFKMSTPPKSPSPNEQLRSKMDSMSMSRLSDRSHATSEAVTADDGSNKL